MNNINTLLYTLNQWYKSKCNGIWEHSNGLTLETLDNPGWHLKITGEYQKQDINIQKDINESTWLFISANEFEFNGFSSIELLGELLNNARMVESK